MYGALERFGFKGGRILEPACGIGHFVGLMPEDMLQRSSITGIEIDPLSARIANPIDSVPLLPTVPLTVPFPPSVPLGPMVTVDINVAGLCNVSCPAVILVVPAIWRELKVTFPVPLLVRPVLPEIVPLPPKE
jgi:hypothetical protein